MSRDGLGKIYDAFAAFRNIDDISENSRPTENPADRFAYRRSIQQPVDELSEDQIRLARKIRKEERQKRASDKQKQILIKETIQKETAKSTEQEASEIKTDLTKFLKDKFTIDPKGKTGVDIFQEQFYTARQDKKEIDRLLLIGIMADLGYCKKRG